MWALTQIDGFHMSVHSDDPPTRLAFSAHRNPKVCALLAGPGVSRAESIPTGRDITLDLICRVAEAEGQQRPNALEMWHMDKTGNAPNRSALLADRTPQEHGWR